MIFEVMLHYLTKLNKNKSMLIGTDLNLDLNSGSNNVRKFVNIIKSFNLFYTNLEPTRLDACLDYFITD